jgi:hypothetical protein
MRDLRVNYAGKRVFLYYFLFKKKKDIKEGFGNDIGSTEKIER